MLYDHASSGARLQHAADGSFSFRDDQAQADVMLTAVIPNKHIIKGNFVWDLPISKRPAPHGERLVSSSMTGSCLVCGQHRRAHCDGSWRSLQRWLQLLERWQQHEPDGSPDYPARVRIVGDPGSGCSSDLYRQFNASAFQGQAYNSVGLESPAGYLRGCFQSAFDLAIARNIRMGGARNLQLRVEMFNAPNQAIGTARNTTMNLASPSDPVTITNLPYDPANGTILPTRVKPSNVGFGQATGFQNPRSVQAQIRFSF